MNYNVHAEADNSVRLDLGQHSAVFKKGVTPEEITAGVENLIQLATGISTFDLILAVMKEFTSQNG